SSNVRNLPKTQSVHYLQSRNDHPRSIEDSVPYGCLLECLRRRERKGTGQHIENGENEKIQNGSSYSLPALPRGAPRCRGREYTGIVPLRELTVIQTYTSILLPNHKSLINNH